MGQNAGMTTSMDDKPALPPKSQVILNEIFEKHPKSPSMERVRACFDILEQLKTTAGPFATVLEIVISELKNSVYSVGITSSLAAPYYERIPFCELVDRINQERDEEQKKYETELKDLRQKLKFRDQDLNIVNRQNLFLKTKLENYEASEKKLNYYIQDLKITLDQKEADLDLLDVEHKIKQDALEKEINSLRAANAQATAAIEKLTMFKSANAHGQDAKVVNDKDSIKRFGYDVTPENILQYDLFQSAKVQKQFAEILDFLLDDYEQQLEQLYHKRQIMLGVKGTLDPEALEIFLSERSIIEESYRNKMEKYLKEHKLLLNHADGLKMLEKSQKINKKLPSIEPLSDNMYRKHAIVMSISTDGETYKDFEEPEFCCKCAAKAVACPHEGVFEKAIQLSPDRYIKFRNPPLKLNSKFELDLKHTNMYDKEVLTEDELPAVSAASHKIWKDFYGKWKGKKALWNRTYSLEKVMVTITHIHTVKWEEEVAIEPSMPGEILKFADAFYKDMKQLYMYEDIDYKPIHDLLTALQGFEKTNLTVYHFSQALAGFQEEVWKYLYLVKKLVEFESTPETTMNLGIYRKKIRLLYPDRPDDVYEHMEIEFISFCENKFEKDSILEHTMHMLKKGTEPNVQFFYKTYDKWDTESAGSLNLDEYIETCLKLIPSTKVEESSRRFRLIENDYENGKVPLDRLAYISAYLLVYNCYLSGWQAKSQIPIRYADFRNNGKKDVGNEEVSVPEPLEGEESPEVE